MKSILLLLAVSFTLGAYAQGISDEQVVGPSPTAASLGKYGEIPVSKYTGVPNIDIPLYTIQTGDITVPISMSFHASGYKVGEAAGWTGLGWSINSGGVVSRSTRGRSDESHGYFDNINTVLDWTDVQRSFIYMGAASGTFENIAAEAIPIKEKMWEIHALNQDLEPDIFYYNFPGGSGKFMFNEDQEIIQMPYQDMRIAPTSMSVNSTGSGSISGFDIFTPSGHKYRFDQQEETNVRLPLNNEDNYISAWYLNGITSSISNKNVGFRYSPTVSLTFDPISSYSLTERVNEVAVEDSPLYSISGPGSTERDGTIQSRYLEEINWDQGIVRFISSGGRLDLYGESKKLDEVIVENLSGEVIKHYRFVYSYFYSNDGSDDVMGRFLRLDKIIEVDKNNEERDAYSFEYNEGVPHRNSAAVDHFGFYNGEHGNDDLIPPYIRAGGFTKMPGANREPSPGASKVGMLHTITYPTGGKTVFNYEPHDYYGGESDGGESEWEYGGYSVAGEFCNPDGSLYTVYNEDVIDRVPGQNEDEGPDCTVNSFDIGLECDAIKEQVFDIPTLSRNFSISLTTSYTSSVCGPTVVINNHDLNIGIYEIIGESEVRVWYYTQVLRVTDEIINLNSFISPGKRYKIRAESKVQGASIRGEFIFEKRRGNVVAINTRTSGIRIQSIEHYDLNNSKPVRKISYQYRRKDYPDRSSGNLLARTPIYQYSTRHLDANGGGENTFYTLYTHSSSPTGMLGSLNNSHIIYEEVVEKEEGNGMTRSFFSWEVDELIPSASQRPSGLEMASSAWKSGHLIKEEVYNEAGTLLSETENEYDYISKGISKGMVTELALDWTPPLYFNDFRWAFGYQRSGWAKLNRTKETYYPESGDPHIKITDYSYGAQGSDLILPTGISYDFNNDLDYSQSTEYLNNRGGEYVISPVKSQNTYNEVGELIRQQRNEYGDGSSANIYKPIFRRLLDENDNIISEVNLQYSPDPTQGLNPGYVTSNKGERVEYLYGHNNTLPIAQVVETDKGYSYYNSFENDPAATTSQSKTGSKAHNSGNYSIAPQEYSPPDETDLKMSYWFWDGDSWEFSGELDFNRNINSPGSLIDELRVYQQGAQMTTYTYRPLVGITSVTDSNNITRYYEYDELNRLLGIRDHEGNIIENYHYQYWNE